MEAVREQMELTNEISEAISNPVGMGIDVSPSLPCSGALADKGRQVDDQELADELAELEQDELNKRLAGADNVPLHLPSLATPAGASPISHQQRLISCRFSSHAGSSYRGRRGRSRVTRATSGAGHVVPPSSPPTARTCSVVNSLPFLPLFRQVSLHFPPRLCFLARTIERLSTLYTVLSSSLRSL